MNKTKKLVEWKADMTETQINIQTLYLEEHLIKVYYYYCIQ